MRVFVAWRSDHEGCLWHGGQIMRVFVVWLSDHENVCGLGVRS